MESIDTTISIKQYSTLPARLGAYLLDTLVLLPFTLPVTIYNITTLKSFQLHLWMTVLTLFYRPVLEWWYGATIGKWAVGLQVVTNRSFGTISFVQALGRSALHMFLVLLQLPMLSYTFRLPVFQQITSYVDFLQLLHGLVSMRIYNQICIAVMVVNCLFLFLDKKNRFLHDRLAKTVCLSTEKK